MVTQTVIYTCELSVREAVGGSSFSSPAYRSGMQLCCAHVRLVPPSTWTFSAFLVVTDWSV